MEELKQIIANEIEQVSADVGVGYKDLQTGETLFFNKDKRYLSASTFKVPVLVELYRQVLEGRLDLMTKYPMQPEDIIFGSGVIQHLQPGLELTLKDYAILMMIVSDNTATDIVTNLVGKDNVNHTMASLGLHNTKVMMTCKELLFDCIGIKSGDDEHTRQEKLLQPQFDPHCKALTDYEDNDLGSPGDMVELLELVYHRKILNDFACTEIIDIMSKCQSGHDRLPYWLPPSVKVAHKTGTLAGTVNDVGIIYTDKGDYVLAVYYHGATDKSVRMDIQGPRVIANISQKIYNYRLAQQG